MPDITEKSRGIIFIIFAAFFFSLMAASVKLAGEVPLMQKIFFRNFIAIFVALFMLKKSGESIRGNNLPFLTLRSVLGFLGVLCNFYAISNLYLADANILNNTNPFFVIVFSFIFLKEPIKKFQVPILGLAFLGAIFVIKPQFNYTIIPSITGLTSGMFAGGAYCVLRYLRDYDSPQTIVFYFAAISTLISFPFLVLGEYVAPTPIQWVGLLGAGICATIAQFLITNAYRYAPASELSIYNYTQILFTLLWGMLFWGEILDLLSIVGGVLIITAAYVNYRYTHQQKVVDTHQRQTPIIDKDQGEE